MKGRRFGAFAVFAGLALTLSLGATPATAGPPFLTDDPQPIDYRHSEGYLFSTMDKGAGNTAFSGPAIEYNYGPAPNVHLHIVVPDAWSLPAGSPQSTGLGDIEFGTKFRFVQETNGTPQIGVFPMIELPTGNAANGLGNGRAWFRLPLWAQKSWGPWTAYGGGGHAINRASGMSDYNFGGGLLQRDFGNHLTLGGEIFAQGPTTAGGSSATFYNWGGYVKPSDTFNVLFSVGHTFAGESHAIGYFALYWTWGPHEAEQH